jgi:hypothetical protein
VLGGKVRQGRHVTRADLGIMYCTVPPGRFAVGSAGCRRWVGLVGWLMARLAGETRGCREERRGSCCGFFVQLAVEGRVGCSLVHENIWWTHKVQYIKVPRFRV